MEIGLLIVEDFVDGFMWTISERLSERLGERLKQMVLARVEKLADNLTSALQPESVIVLIKFDNDNLKYLTVTRISP